MEHARGWKSLHPRSGERELLIHVMVTRQDRLRLGIPSDMQFDSATRNLLPPLFSIIKASFFRRSSTTFSSSARTLLSLNISVLLKDSKRESSRPALFSSHASAMGSPEEENRPAKIKSARAMFLDLSAL